MDAIVIYCTVPDKRVAKEISKHLIKHRLAACISAVDKVESMFSWDGEIEHEKEVLLIIKTLRTTKLHQNCYKSLQNYWKTPT